MTPFYIYMVDREKRGQGTLLDMWGFRSVLAMAQSSSCVPRPTSRRHVPHLNLFFWTVMKKKKKKKKDRFCAAEVMMSNQIFFSRQTPSLRGPSLRQLLGSYRPLCVGSVVGRKRFISTSARMTESLPVAHRPGPESATGFFPEKIRIAIYGDGRYGAQTSQIQVFPCHFPTRSQVEAFTYQRGIEMTNGDCTEK